MTESVKLDSFVKESAHFHPFTAGRSISSSKPLQNSHTLDTSNMLAPANSSLQMKSKS
ncbi:hypothetical protein MAP00_003040 [Monascus purpureus]|nr:hypothetical protein MAP00_003040 [Monascus purpureus]